MSNPNEMTPIASEDYEAFLPEGWAESDDFFDVDSWTGSSKSADESADGDGQEADTEATESETDTAPAIESDGNAEESEDDSDEARATEQTAERPKLKFSAQVDHKVEDVELDETELPTLYQKAHVTDRVKAKLSQMQPIIDKGNRLAKILGYDTIDAMLDSAENSYRQGEIDRLTGEGVHPDVAKELVESRASRAVGSIKPDDSAIEEETPRNRDFKAEVADLLSSHPELRGKNLPESVINDTVFKGMSLTGAYEKYKRQQSEAENKAIKAENKRLKQNADAASRAPVRGVSKGGAPDNEPDDPFLIGFNKDRW